MYPHSKKARFYSHLTFETLERRIVLTANVALPGGSLDWQSIEAMPGELLIGFHSNVPAAEVSSFYNEYNLQVIEDLHVAQTTGGLHRVTVAADIDATFPGVLAADVRVAFAEPNYVVTTARLPSDPRFDDLWGLHNVGQDGGTADADIDAVEAWDVATGSKSIVVGVIDSGIDYTHPDLYLNAWINQGEIPSNLSLTDTDGDQLITFADLNDSTNASWVSDTNNNQYIDGGDLLADIRWVDTIDTDNNGSPTIYSVGISSTTTIIRTTTTTTGPMYREPSARRPTTTRAWSVSTGMSS